MSLLLSPATASGGSGPSLVWETSTDWDNAVSESGVVHESTANTDHDDATIVKQGYPYGSFDLITPDPLLCYPLHEDTGTTANDLAGTNDGTVNGASIGVTGLLGTTAYSFDGTDDYVAVPDLSLNSGSSFTVVGWVSLDNSSGNQVLFGRYDGSDDILSLFWDGSNWQVRIGHANGNEQRPQGGTTNSGAYTQIALVYDASTPSSTLYQDASSVDSDASAIDDFATTGGPNIGRRSDGVEYLAGDVAEVRVYNAALSQSELQTLNNVVNTPGDWLSATKSFGSAQSPDLVADVSLNTVASFAVDVIGSPSGSSETQTVTVNSDGENTYSITWAGSHSDFRVNPKPDNGSDVSVTPTINKLELSA